MKKIALLLVALCIIVISCQKNVKEPVSYTVESAQGTALPDIFVPDSGSYDLAVWVKFLTGTNEDSVTLVLKGLPSDVVPAKDTVTGLPSFIGHFILNTKHAVQTKYPVTIVATARGSQPKTYNFNMTVIPADCASYLVGNYNGSNGCTGRSYTYTAAASATGTINTLDISNFGGYGTGTTTRVYINCTNNTLSIPSQNIGNGTTLSGSGSYTGTKMTIQYTASNTPGGIPETCSAELTKF